MPSRRIASYPNLAPIQELSVNPFSSFNSNVVNKLTRIVSCGKDVIVSGLDTVPNKDSYITSYGNFVSPLWDYSKNWKYSDTVYPILNSEEITNFTTVTAFDVSIDHNVPSGTAYIKYLVPSNIFKYLNGNDTIRTFKYSFEIVTGDPASVIVDVNGDRKRLDNPRSISTNVDILVDHNFLSDSNFEDYIPVTLYFILDVNQTTCSYPHQNEASTYVRITRPQISVFSNINQINNLDYISSGDIDGNYSFSNIHPSRKISVYPGILIKDDMMLNPCGQDPLNNKEIVELTISDKNSWIHGNPYQPNEFLGNQKVFILNGSENVISVDGQYVDGKLVIQGKFNDIQDPDTIYNIPLTDDNELTDADMDLNIKLLDPVVEDVENITFEVEKTKIGSYHSRLALWYYQNKDEKIVFKRSILGLHVSGEETLTSTISINKSEIPFTITSNNVSNIKCCLSLGTVKVSGTSGEYSKDNTKWAYIVCYYTYFKNPTPNISYYGLIREEDLLNDNYREDYVILSKVRVVDCGTIDIIDYHDRQRLVTDLKNISAKNVEYGKFLPTENGFNESSYWRDSLDGDVNVPDNVSDALSTLAKRRINDIIKEDDKLTYKSDVTMRDCDTAVNLISPNEENNQTIARVNSNNGNISSYKILQTQFSSDYDIEFGNLSGYYFDGTTDNSSYSSGVFRPISEEDVRFKDSVITDNGFYWILKRKENEDIHSTDGDTLELNAPEWIIIKNDDITKQLYSEFRQNVCNYILIKYHRAYKNSEGTWIFDLDTESLYISNNKKLPLSFIDADDSNNFISFQIVRPLNPVLNDNMWTMAKIPSSDNTQEDAIIGFGTQASTANLKFIKYNKDLKFSDSDKLEKYSDNNLVPTTLSKTINRIPSTTTENRAVVWEDNNGNIRDGNEWLDESLIEKASIICRNGEGSGENITQYSKYTDGKFILKDSGISKQSVVDTINKFPQTTPENANIVEWADDGKLKDSGVKVSKIAEIESKLNSGFVGLNSNFDKVEYNSSNYIESGNRTKPYTATKNGVLIASFRWDCNGSDGVHAVFYNGATEIARIRVFQNVEYNGTDLLSTVFTVPLGEGVTFRFVGDSNFFSASGHYLNYLFVTN